MKSFKDKGGREWTCRVNCRTMERYEELSNSSLLSAVHSLLAEMPKDEKGAPRFDSTNVLAALSKLFGGKFGNMLKAIWASVEGQHKLSYDEFFAAIEGSETDVFNRALEAYFDFFQRTMARTNDVVPSAATK